MNKRILAAQTCIVGDSGAYHDYRDYIFSLLSSEFLQNEVVRINIEKGQEYAKELQDAATQSGFVNTQITAYQPNGWATYIQSQIKEFKTPWTMLFPGDHIYTHADRDYLHRMLDAADKVGAEAVSYGHIQDWDYLLDWGRIKVVEDTPEYVVIKWGWKWIYCRNKKLTADALQKIGIQIVINPVPGYMLFRSEFLNQILSAIPESVKWHDVEHINHPLTQSFKILIPKQYIYRHVHGYWLEHYFEALLGQQLNTKDTKKILENMYIRPQYNWRTNQPSALSYLHVCEERYPYLRQYRADGGSLNLQELIPASSLFSLSEKNTLKHRVANAALNMLDRVRYRASLTYRKIKINR